MSETLRIDPAKRKEIETAVHAEINMCWTCGSCASECPVNIATDRLQPRKIVWMANLGLLDELVRLPEVWYCQTCNRCSQVCPNTVKPSAVISFLRLEAVARGLVTYDQLRRYKALFCRFHQARWYAALACREEGELDLSGERWSAWLKAPRDTAVEDRPIRHLELGDLRKAIEESGLSSCFTCGECSSGCPVCSDRGVFDPRRIFRMANLGMARELLSSPSIWLCLECRRCTIGCSQRVEGHRMIRRLQELAVEKELVDENFPDHWHRASRRLYPFLLKEIDSLLGF